MCVHNNSVQDYHIHDGYLFKGSKLCILDCSLQLWIIEERHGGGLGGHFGCDKTIDLVENKFHWPKLRKDVERNVQRCMTCHLAKSHSQNTGRYTPLLEPQASCEDISMDFIVGLLKKKQGFDSVMVVVDHFLKMAHFIPCKTTMNASNIAHIYFREIVKLHGIHTTITSDKESF